jgi:hypothetical protein
VSTVVAATAAELTALHDRWAAAWPAALEAWSRFTRLRPPLLCLDAAVAQREGLTDSFAMIRLVDQAIIVSLPAVRTSRVEAFPREILAHEIGHHVLAPATLTDHARMIARMRRALPTVEKHAPMVANLYSDLLINDRLQRSAGLRLAEVYRILGAGGASGRLWGLYLRIYEILWSLERGSLGGQATDDVAEGDAWLGARLLRTFARDWLEGCGRFAMLLLPYLLDDQRSESTLRQWHDTRDAAAGGEPAGLVDEDAGERDGAVHPVRDPDLADVGGDEPEEGAAPTDSSPRADQRRGEGQAREPFEYGEILRAAGFQLDDHEAAVRYYRERARPYLIPFPSRRVPEAADPLPEGLEPWDAGHPLDAADWLQSVLQSPRIVPGMTTVQRVWGTTEGREAKRVPLDLDLYVDCSGSMPNPQRTTSYPALAGAILCCSALRAGARVQATLWSGKQQFTTTDGFVRDEAAILRVLTGYFGGGTQFPLHILRDTYARRPPASRLVHILVISDDGVSTMFDRDERGAEGWAIATQALARAGGGGTFVLDLPAGWEAVEADAYAAIRRAHDEGGWRVHRVAGLEELVAFAREFSRLTYGPPEAAS